MLSASDALHTVLYISETVISGGEQAGGVQAGIMVPMGRYGTLGEGRRPTVPVSSGTACALHMLRRVSSLRPGSLIASLPHFDSQHAQLFSRLPKPAPSVPATTAAVPVTVVLEIRLVHLSICSSRCAFIVTGTRVGRHRRKLASLRCHYSKSSTWRGGRGVPRGHVENPDGSEHRGHVDVDAVSETVRRSSKATTDGCEIRRRRPASVRPPRISSILVRTEQRDEVGRCARRDAVKGSCYGRRIAYGMRFVVVSRIGVLTLEAQATYADATTRQIHADCGAGSFCAQDSV
ncbi:hypothetical protein BV25DRAFT_1843108 [Artomyces pyxidatus]|uniref:Uncharacterized protein n=1 Tax=Artomyces pyxidatus TaxID=48021 RepID=A0ACB8SFG1_9AGAM|nr:hypothetical protein BV25DRAFT_1843108 [Artomyces pyxidatus]